MFDSTRTDLFFVSIALVVMVGTGALMFFLDLMFFLVFGWSLLAAVERWLFRNVGGMR